MMNQKNITNNKEKKNNNQDFIIYKTYKKNNQCNTIMRNNFKNKYSNIINFIFFNIILYSTLKIIESANIAIKVNEAGVNKILSDDYIGILPNKVYINDREINLNGNTIFVNSQDQNSIINLEWDTALSIFSFMFSNLSNIIYVHIPHDIVDTNYDIAMDYMFKNCINLVMFYYSIDYAESITVKNLEGMFYNCSSLTSINLTKFGFNSDINLSYMFYNCKQLETIVMPYSYDNFAISDMYQTFYNCKSLKEIEILNKKRNSNAHLDLSQLFYNCKNLINISINFNNMHIINSIEMFYNCYSLKSIDFNPYNLFDYINMTKMFYNCYSIETIHFNPSDNSLYYNPGDMSYMFYNCKELKTLIINYLNTQYVKHMKFMLYNCESLEIFDIHNSNFNNILITNMKGMFKNLKSLTSLDLTNFYTPNVTIMWDMFNGCNKLMSLSIPNFDTSKVTDMQSMFEGCINLASLNLNHFNTTNVQYMNKMFQNCISLTSLNFRYLTTESLGTMYRMFYNCQSLKYLNLYSLTETSQSIVEMFKASSISFKLCIKDEKNIPNIYQDIFEKIERDCSNDCYFDGNNRQYIENKKSCCSKFIYNDSCYDQCPIRTKEITDKKKCEDLNCTYYYKYGQRSCSNNNTIPDGYYMNDTILKTIDKCNENCKTCNGPPTNISTNCLTCKDENPYIYLGNCFNSCLYGEYNDANGNKKCKCFNTKCLKCSEESIKQELCEECNENYYPKADECRINPRFIDCYKEPEEYYLAEIDEMKMYKHCYHSCKYCINEGDKQNHYCISCNNKNSFSILNENNETYNNYTNYTIMNCYPVCMYNYFIDDDYNYICLSQPGCPENAKLLINGTTQCVKTCKNNSYKYEFQEKCYLECPPESKGFENATGFYCKADCPPERPFEMNETQTCHECCKIMDRYNKSCTTNYHGNKTDEIHDMIMTCIREDIIDTFDYNYITKNRSLILNEYPFIYEITSTDCTYVNPDLGKMNLKKCDQRLRDFYMIPKTIPLYILKIDAHIEGKLGPKIQYEVYCPYDSPRLRQLDISICEGLDITIEVPINITIDNIDKYDKYSGYYNDICYTYTNENGTDVTLEDRQEEFKTNNRSVCDEGCRLVGIGENNERAECSCGLVFNIPFASQISVDKDKLYEFMNIKNIANFKIMVCYKLFFSIKGIKENIGFYCLLLTLVVYFICLFYFYSKEYKQIKLIVNEIVYAKKHEKYLDKKNNALNKKTIFINYIEKRRLEHNFKIENIIRAENKIASFTNKKNLKQDDTNNINNIDNDNNDFNILDKKADNFEITQAKNEIIINSEKNKTEKEMQKVDEIKPDLEHEVNKIKNSPPKKSIIKTKYNKNTLDLSSSSKGLFPHIKLIHNINNKKFDQLNEKQKQKIIYILSYIDSELDDLSYKKAVEYDRRSYFQFYLSLLNTNHSFIKIFNKRDYNARSIKVLLFFFDFASNYAVNALFFNDDTMHQIYDDGGDFNIIYQLPQIIYSTIISIIIDSLISYLGLSQDDILSVKHVKKVSDVDRRAKEVLRTLHIKFIFFFIIILSFILLYWYYLGCFCAVYTNTQFHLIKDTLIGYGTGFIIPLGKSFVPGIFRIPTLKKYGKGKKVVYKLSQFLQKI